MSNKYRVISIQYVDVFAEDIEESFQIANNYHLENMDTPRGMRYSVTAFDYERGLDQDTLMSIGIDIDDSDNGFDPINDPF